MCSICTAVVNDYMYSNGKFYVLQSNMYIYTPLCRYWIALYRYVLVFIVPHVDIELEDNKQFTWVHYFEPVRKVSNKIWATKHSKHPIIAKRSLSTKKVLYAIFFCGEGVTIKVPVKKGKSITGKYFKDVVLKKLKKYYQKRRPATGFKHVRLLHDNAPAHTSAIVTGFLKKEKVTVLPHHPYFPDLAPCDFFLFLKLKAFLAGRKYQSQQALGSAIHQYLITVPKSAYRDAFKKWIHRLKLCISSHGEYFEGMKWLLLG